MRSARLLAPVSVLGLGFVLACSSAESTSAIAADAGAARDAAKPGQCGLPLTSSKVSLPADDGLHTPEKVEWWYWTGHAKTKAGRWFGYEEVFFRAEFGGFRGVMVHSAVTDEVGRKFFHKSAIDFGDLPKKDSSFAYALAKQTVSGGGGHDELHGEGEGYSFDMTLDDAKRPTLQHGAGYTDYSFGGYTYYYSRERMAAKGTIRVGAESFEVEGTGWFDHQYGDLGSAVNKGWDWFAIQLDDGREIMLFVVKDAQQPIVVGASMTDADCVTTELATTDFDVTPKGTWTSPHTGCTYPQGWDVRVKDLRFTVAPVLDDQEVHTSKPIYWEGAATVSGGVTGRAYVELAGYCENPTTR